jgi:hypothetical protein
MKRSIFGGMIFAVLLGLVRADEGKFSSSLSPDELAAAGLAGLTPAQLTRLNSLVEAYKSGALATARRAADEALAAKQAAEAQAARSEAVAAAARADAAKAEAARAAAVRTDSAKPDPSSSILAKARSLLKSSSGKVEVAAIESSLPGKFRGWEPRQVFTLANGQRYQVAENQSYYSPALDSPRVQVVPATFAGFWLRFPDLDAQVRVEFVGDK